MTDTQNEQLRAAVSGHKKRNLELIDVFVDKKVDLKEGRSVELHFWVPNKQDAAFLAKALYERTFLILALTPSEYEGTRGWLVEAGAQKTILEMVSDEFTEEMVRLAADHSAEYGGWGTSV